MRLGCSLSKKGVDGRCLLDVGSGQRGIGFWELRTELPCGCSFKGVKEEREGESVGNSQKPKELPSGCSFNEFKVVSSDYVKKLITSSNIKSCSSDPVPTSIIKICQVITYIIHLSLVTSCSPRHVEGWEL